MAGVRSSRAGRGGNRSAVTPALGLPQLSGYDIARHVRARRGGDVLLVAITGWGQEEDRRRAREAGFDHHFTKPADFDRLLELIGQELRQRHRDN